MWRGVLALAIACGCGDNAPVLLTFNFDGTAALVAVQDGDGPWERLLPDAEGQVDFEVEAGRYGFVVLCGDFDAGPRFVGYAFAHYDVNPGDIFAGCSFTSGSAEQVTLSGRSAPGA